MKKTAVIAGASGLIGTALLPLLLQNDEYEAVHSVGRRMLDVRHEKLTQHIVDFSDLSSLNLPCHHVYCCVGTTIRVAGSKERFVEVDHDYPLNLARAALRNGAQSYTIITSVGAKAESAVFYSSVKGRVERELALLGFKSLTIIRPSMLLGDRKQSRPAEWISKHLMTLLAPIIPKAYKAVHDSTVAACMLRHTLAEHEGVRIIENADILSMT